MLTVEGLSEKRYEGTRNEYSVYSFRISDETGHSFQPKATWWHNPVKAASLAAQIMDEAPDLFEILEKHHYDPEQDMAYNLDGFRYFHNHYFKQYKRGYETDDYFISGLHLSLDDDGKIRNQLFILCRINIGAEVWQDFENCVFLLCDDPQKSVPGVRVIAPD